MEKPLDAQVETHVVTLIESLANEYPVSARAPLSDTHPALDQPVGMLSVAGGAASTAEEAGWELVVTAEGADGVTVAEV